MKRLIAVMMLMIALTPTAVADETKVWVMCQPDSFVNIRAKPSVRSSTRIEGYAYCGIDYTTDDKSSGGFLHIYALIEAGQGWVSEGYIVYDEPIEVNAQYMVVSNGRVALRKTIDGKRIMWLHDGDIITVSWISNEWALTKKGFIRSEFLTKVEDIAE